jgi:hypothetical protein
MTNILRLKAGEWVEVRGREEILRTLDHHAQLDGLPFMPQMFQYCGKRFQIFKRAHKTCDTVFPVRGRRMANAVHLDVRCDGDSYGGCQAGCLIFWKAAWLKRVEAVRGDEAVSPCEQPGMACSRDMKAGCTEEDVWAGTRAAGQGPAQERPIVCQATQLPYATKDLSWWDVRQYIEDYTSGNAGLARIVRGFVYMGYHKLANAGIGVGAILRWLYDGGQGIWGGVPYPRRYGSIPRGAKTPGGELGLQPGELVRVKSYKAILATVDQSNKNRGLYFDAEMVPFCGRTFRVLKRVTRIVDEKTGKLLEFKNPCIILEGVACESRYSECRLFCPRSIYAYWREIWLERVGEKEVEG